MNPFVIIKHITEVKKFPVSFEPYQNGIFKSSENIIVIPLKNMFISIYI